MTTLGALEPLDAVPESFTSLGIVGAGLMGSGLAQVAALAGLQVRLYDNVAGAATRACDSVARHLGRQVDKGHISVEDREAALDRIACADDLESVAASDATIEAVVEQLSVKRKVFRVISVHAREDAVLATNTSAISISEIAADAEGAERVIGMHFFSPVPLMTLCEIIRGLRTSDATLASARALAIRLGKASIVVNRDDAGFVTSRLMTTLTQEAVRLLESGLATAEDIDKACVLGFGHTMGPLATADLTGIDVAYRAGRSIYEATGDPAFHPPQTLKRMIAAGRLGRKTGRGFYDYEERP